MFPPGWPLLFLTTNKEYDMYAYLFQTTETVELRSATETFLTVVVVPELHLLEEARGHRTHHR